MLLEYVKVLSAIALGITTFFFTMLPMCLKYRISLGNNLRVMSFLSCFGAGVFLSTCLLHLFPDVQEQMELVFKLLKMDPNYPVSEFLFGFGFLAILIVEQIVLNCQEIGDLPIIEHSNENPPPDEAVPFVNDHAGPNYGAIETDANIPQVDIATISNSILRSLLLLLALSLHSIFEGLAIGLQTSVQSHIRILVAVLIHKSIIAFTLGLNLTQSQLQGSGVLKSTLFFSLSSPVGILIGSVVVDFVKGFAMEVTSGVLQGLAAGTFLYVTLFEILPKELCTGTDRMGKMGCVVFGYSVVCILLIFLPD